MTPGDPGLCRARRMLPNSPARSKLQYDSSGDYFQGSPTAFSFRTTTRQLPHRQQPLPWDYFRVVTRQLWHGRGSYFGVGTALRLRIIQNDLWTVSFVPAILNVLRTRIRAAHLAWSMSS